MPLPTEPSQPDEKNVLAKDLAQHHVGRNVKLSWTNGHTITGRLAVLRFAQRTERFIGGKNSLGDRTCTVVLEVADEDVEIGLPMLTQIELQA